MCRCFAPLVKSTQQLTCSGLLQLGQKKTFFTGTWIIHSVMFSSPVRSGKKNDLTAPWMNSESLELFDKSRISWIKGSLLTVFFFLLCLLQTVVGIVCFFLHSQSQVIWWKSWSSSDSPTCLWNTSWEVVHPIWGWAWRLSILYVTGDLYDLNTLVMPLQSVTVCYFLSAVAKCCCPVNVFLCLLLTSFHILSVWREFLGRHSFVFGIRASVPGVCLCLSSTPSARHESPTDTQTVLCSQVDMSSLWSKHKEISKKFPPEKGKAHLFA